jgi:hypothetical protein
MQSKITQLADVFTPFVEWRNSPAPCTMAKGPQHASREARSLDSYG